MAQPVTFEDLKKVTDALANEVIKALATERQRIAELEETVAHLRRELEADGQ